MCGPHPWVKSALTMNRGTSSRVRVSLGLRGHLLCPVIVIALTPSTYQASVYGQGVISLHCVVWWEAAIISPFILGSHPVLSCNTDPYQPGTYHSRTVHSSLWILLNKAEQTDDKRPHIRQEDKITLKANSDWFMASNYGGKRKV